MLFKPSGNLANTSWIPDLTYGTLTEPKEKRTFGRWKRLALAWIYKPRSSLWIVKELANVDIETPYSWFLFGVNQKLECVRVLRRDYDHNYRYSHRVRTALRQRVYVLTSEIPYPYPTLLPSNTILESRPMCIRDDLEVPASIPSRVPFW
jgi:hypothetical protein